MKRLLKNIGLKVFSIIFRFLAKQLLKRHKPKIIAITGSVGKTSTKRAVAAVVEGDYRTQWHDGNYNSELGLPQALFELKSPEDILNPLPWLRNTLLMIAKLLLWRYPYDLLVLELGIDKVGDMKLFSRYIQADIGIITAIQPAHVAGIGDLETIYREKTMMAEFSKLVVVNGDDQLLGERLKNNKGVLSYGFKSDNTVNPDSFEQKSDGGSVLSIGNHRINGKLVGKHSYLPMLAAWLIGKELGINSERRIRALEELKPYPGRMNPLPGKNHSLIIDDSYNAVTPQAVTAALDALTALPATRRIAVLGTMNELGDLSEQLHHKVGRYVANLDLDMLVTIGQNAEKYLANAAISSGIDTKNVHSFDSPYKAGHFLAPQLRKGDVVLVKGSQNRVFSEEATALLLKNESDRSQLVRQGAFYQRIKHEQFDQA